MSLPLDSRTTDLAKIHLAIKQLGISKDDHRSLMMQLYGIDSSANLTGKQRQMYLSHLRKLGFKPMPPKSKKLDRSIFQTPEIQKARAIWLMLHALGVVRDPSERAFIAYAAKRQGKVDALHWQQRPDLLIESLKAWSMRHLPKHIDSKLNELGWPIPSGCVHPNLYESLVKLVQSLGAARFRGNQALFDYYWPIWEIFQLPKTA